MPFFFFFFFFTSFRSSVLFWLDVFRDLSRAFRPVLTMGGVAGLVTVLLNRYG